MKLKTFVASFACALSALAVGCSGASETTNTNTATNMNAVASSEARTAPDNSEIRMESVGGVTTETRTFRDPNSRIERVVVTTRDGRRTARVYYRDRTVKELPDTEVGRALDATGDALVSAGGTVVDASKAVGSEIGDKAEDVGDKAKDVGKEAADKAEDVGGAAASGAKKVGSEVGDKAEDVGDKAASGAKKVGKETVKGAKKVGNAVKDAVTP